MDRRHGLPLSSNLPWGSGPNIEVKLHHLFNPVNSNDPFEWTAMGETAPAKDSGTKETKSWGKVHFLTQMMKSEAMSKHLPTGCEIDYKDLILFHDSMV